MGFIGSWVATFIATLAAINLIPGIVTVGGTWLGPIMVSLVLSLLNASIKPFLQLIGLPFTILTLGIFAIVINAGLLELSSFLARNILGAGIYIESFGAALLGAIVISIVTMIVDAITGIA